MKKLHRIKKIASPSVRVGVTARGLVMNHNARLLGC